MFAPSRNEKEIETNKQLVFCVLIKHGKKLLSVWKWKTHFDSDLGMLFVFLCCFLKAAH